MADTAAGAPGLAAIERQIRAALQELAFEANVASTWARAVTAVSAVLEAARRAGGLTGATAADAFAVQCGLGSTMKPADILNDRLILTARLQTSPGAFQDLTFVQQMAAGG